MTKKRRTTVRFQRRTETVFDTFRVRGRNYLVLEKLSRRGAFRVFDRHAGPDGDYRILYQFSKSKMKKHKIEIIRRLGGKTANRNFPQLVDYAEIGESIFVVLSWVWGTNLRDYLQAIRDEKVKRPSVTEVVRLFRGLTHGVSHFHRKANVIHGDISPANIILTTGTKQLVLVDFGSAWPIEESANSIIGDGATLPYAAPERIASHAPEDFRSDVFSLAVVAYELLTLEVPYDGLGGHAGLPKLVQDNLTVFANPSSLLPSPNRPTRRAISLLDKLFRTSLSLHPNQRFGTKNDWLAAWDELHREFQKGSRLNNWEVIFLRGIERLMGIFRI